MRGRKKDAFGRAVDAYLSVQRASTQRQYHGVFEEWLKFLRGQAPTKVSELDVLRFAKVQSEHLGFRGVVSKSTVARKLLVLRGVYALLQEGGEVKANPVSSVLRSFRKAPTGDKRPTELIPFEDVARLLEAPSAVTHEGQRDRCFLSLLFGCALRVSEASKLRVGDVCVTKMGELYLRLLGTKNGTDADQPVPPTVSEDISRYVATRKEEGATATDPLLVLYYADLRPHQTALQDRQLRRIFKRWVSELKIPGRLSPHSARATAITLLLEMGLSHREVRKFSRHSSVAMVEAYDKLRDTGAEHVAAAVDYKKKFLKDS